MPSPGITVGCQHSGPTGRLGDAWCQVRFHCPLIYHSGVGQPFPDSMDVSLQNRFFRCSLALERNQHKHNFTFSADRTWPFKPSMIQSRSIARPRKPPCLGWPWVVGTLLTFGRWGGMMSWWFQVFCSGLLFWYAMIIAVAELLLACWNVLTVDKNISCLEDDPSKKKQHRLKMIFHCYQPNKIQSSVHVTSCCIISKQTTKHLSCFLFFHYMIKRINLYP